MLKLQLVAVLFVCHLTHSLPIESFVLSDGDDFDTDNYDVIIDQRQNGTQNFRIKVTGLHIAIPQEEDESSSSSTSGSRPTLEQEFASLLIPQTSSSSNSQIGSGLGAFADLANQFDWKKKTIERKKLEDTQSRTKDIPTESQIAADSKVKAKELVKEERRKYKLLVGEKYIIPILRFLKQQTEDVSEE